MLCILSVYQYHTIELDELTSGELPTETTPPELLSKIYLKPLTL